MDKELTEMAALEPAEAMNQLLVKHESRSAEPGYLSMVRETLQVLALLTREVVLLRGEMGKNNITAPSFGVIRKEQDDQGDDRGRRDGSSGSGRGAGGEPGNPPSQVRSGIEGQESPATQPGRGKSKRRGAGKRKGGAQ